MSSFGDPDIPAQVYGRTTCGFCVAALRLLRERGVPHRWVDLTLPENRDLRARLQAETGQATVPFVFVEGRFTGGYMELAALARGGGLDHLAGDGAGQGASG